MNGKVITGIFVVMICFYSCTLPEEKQLSAVPEAKELGRSFGKHDEKVFVSPPKVYHPETWFHFIGGNVSAKGITADLKTWKDLDLSLDGKAFSGTVTYTTSFNVDNLNPETNYTLDLGRVEMIAAVSLKGKPFRTLWSPPYHLDISAAVSKGENHLSVDVTSTWFNRLVYDADRPDDQRKTWTIRGPAKESELRDSGLLGPIVLYAENPSILLIN
jgi:hypothetical protein